MAEFRASTEELNSMVADSADMEFGAELGLANLLRHPQ